MRDVTFDSNGDIVMAGYFNGTLNTGVNTLTSSGNTDIIVMKTNDAGDPVWAVKAGGAGVDRANGIASDSQGNTYITGYFQSNATFGSINVTGQGWEAYAAKIDVNGTFVWVTTFGGSYGDIGHGIDVDNNGNVICVGEYKGTAAFGPDILVSEMNPLSGSPSYDVFVTKLDPSGGFVWTQDGKANYDDKAVGVTTDNAGSVYVIGTFSDTLTFQVPHNSTLSNAGFVIGFDQAGNELWFSKMWGAQVLLSGIEYHNGKVYTTGDFRSNLLVEDINSIQSFPGQEEYNIFAARYDDGGDLDWLSNNFSTSEVHSVDLALDNNGDVYLTGDFNCTFTEMNDIYGESTFLSLGFEDVHYIKYNAAGTFQWGRQMASPKPDMSTAAAIKNANFPVIIGTHEGTFHVPAGGSFTFLPGQQVNAGGSNCSDANYGNFAREVSAGERDIFWTSPFDINRLPFDYFEKDPGINCDLLIHEPCIGTVVPFAMCMDTIEGCAPLMAVLNDFFLDPPAPDYSVSWSNGGSGTSTGLSTEGYYYATTTTADLCYSWTDTVYAVIYPDPDPPLMSDSWNFNSNNATTNNIDTCDADSVLVWATPIGNNDSLVWVGNQNELNDSTIVVGNSGSYSVYAVNEFGCISAENSIDVVINNFALHDTLDPQIIFNDTDIENTDSTLSCGLPFCSSAYLTDNAFINQYGTMPNLYSVWYMDGVYIDTVFHNSDDSTLVAQPSPFNFCVDDIGWHEITAHLVNECGDTVDYVLVDSFYVDTIPIPFVAVAGPPFACPGDTVTITGEFYTDTAYWSGANIIQNYGDSVVAVFNYLTGMNVTLSVDTTVGNTTCNASAAYGLAALAIPQLEVSPTDGVICPGDSVLLTALTGLAWQWIGPTGDSLGTNQTQYATDVGEYFCYVTDANCTVPSEFVVTVAYSSPQLYAWHPVICLGDSSLIQVLGPSNTVINWLPPLSGSNPSQYVDSTGTYYVETEFCGITKIDSIEVEVSLPLENFSFPPDTTICPYDSYLLTAPPGMAQYVWNGVPGINTYTVLDSGSYWLYVEDVAGCSDQSDTIHIGYHALPPPPVATDTTICPGEDATLIALGTGTFDWYNNGGTFVHNGDTLELFNIGNPTNYFVTQSDLFCTSVPDTATISFYPDTIVASFNLIDQCGSLDVQVANTGTPNIDYTWNMGDGTNYTGPFVSHSYPGNGTYTITLYVMDPTCGFADTTSQTVTVYGQSIQLIFNQPTCHQFSDGSLTLDLIDGVGGETFLIEDAAGNPLNVGGSNAANNLPSGWYYWFVGLGPGCTLVDSIFIPDPGPLQVDMTMYPPLCYGLTGSAVVDTVYNWQGNYNNISFIWNPNFSGVGGVWADSAYNMPAGVYTVTVNDDFGCSNVIDFTVTQPPPLTFTEFGSEPAYCRIFDYQSGNGVVYAAASGGTPDYTYTWINLSTGDTTNNTTWGGLNPGAYQIDVVDGNGCVLIDTIEVDSLNPLADFDMTSLDFDVEWEGDAPLEVSFSNQSLYYANPNNPNADTTFFWNFNYDNTPWVTSHSINDVFDTVYTEAGTYTICLAAVNKNGCADTLCKDIIVYDPVVFNPVNIFTPDGDGVNDEFTFVYKAEGIETFKCLVVNRWGVTIREFNDIHDTWDGTDKNSDLCPDGVYFYVYQGVGFNGDEFTGQGSVTLVRGK